MNRWNLHKVRPIYLLLVVVIMTIAVMFPVLDAQLTSWDDEYYILKNDLIHDLSWDRISEIFLTPEMNGSYSPIPIITWAIEYRISGSTPFVYHFTNLFAHLVCTVLVYFLCRRIGYGTFLASLLALLFGIHPMHVEPVAWITARKDLLFSMFILSSLISWSYFLASNEKRYYAMTFSLVLLSLFCKGVAVVAPILVLLLSWYLKRTKIRSYVIKTSPILLLSIVFGLLAVYAQRSAGAIADSESWNPILALSHAGHGLWTFLVHLIWPIHIGAFHPYPIVDSSEINFYSLHLFSFVLVIGLLFFVRKNRRAVFGLMLMIVCLLPTLQIVPVGGALYADRYSYLAYVGGTILLVELLSMVLRDRFESRGYWVVSTLIVLYVFGLGLYANRACAIWNNSVTLWTNTIDHHSNHEVAYLNRARAYSKDGKVGEAKLDLNTALELNPGRAEVYQELGLLEQRIGDHESAISSFEKAIKVDPSFQPAALNLSLSHMQTGNVGISKAVLEKLIHDSTRNIQVYLNLGVVYETDQDFKSAYELYEKAGLMNQWSPRPYEYLTKLSGRTANFNSMLKYALAWAERSPRSGEALLWIARARFSLGQFHQVIPLLEKAERLGQPIDGSFYAAVRDTLNN